MIRNILSKAPLVAFAMAVAPALVHAGFEDATIASGIQFTQVPDPGTPLDDPRILITSGTVWFDYDNDGDEDLYATQGNGCNKLFRNNGDATFTDVANALGVDSCTDASRGTAAADYDNDGFTDLFVTQRDQNRLFRNIDGSSFVDVTAEAGFISSDVTNSGSVSWGDYDGDGFVDIYVAGYVFTKNPNVCAVNQLWHNNGDGTFEEVAAELGVDMSGLFIDPETEEQIPTCTLALVLTDYDDDTDPDIMLVNDFGFEQVRNMLFRNDGPDGLGGWLFTDVSTDAGVDYQQFGMGVARGDIDNDGDFDYYQTSIPDHPTFPAPNALALNNGDGTFTNIGLSSGTDLTGEEFPMVNWGTVMFDADNDTDEDLFVASGGFVSGSPIFPFLLRDPDQSMQPLFSFRNNGDLTFTENRVQAGLTDEQVTRGLSSADYDNDGFQDLYLGNPDGTNVLYRNSLDPATPNTNWLKVKARGTVGNADAIGAQIRVTAGAASMLREIDGGSSFLSMNSKIAHFGLGAAEVAERMTVRFRSGLRFEMRDVAAGQMITVTEPIVTFRAPGSEISVPAGQALNVPTRVTNQTDAEQNIDVWLDLIIAGERQTVRGPLSLNLAAGQQIDGRLPRWAPQNPQTYTVVMSTGTFPDEVIHQSFLDVTVTP